MKTEHCTRENEYVHRLTQSCDTSFYKKKIDEKKTENLLPSHTLHITPKKHSPSQIRNSHCMLYLPFFFIFFSFLLIDRPDANMLLKLRHLFLAI